MSAKLEKALEKLKLLEGGEDLAKIISSEYSTVKQEAIDRRLSSKEMTEKFETLIEKIGAKDADSAVGVVDENTLLMKKIQTQLTDMQGKFEASEKESLQAKAEATRQKIVNKITTLASGLGVDGKEKIEDLVALTSSRYKLDSTGDMVAEDGKVLSEDLADFIQARPHLISGTVSKGAGIPKANAQGANKKSSEYTLAELSVLHGSNPEQYKVIMSERNNELTKNVTHI